MHFWQAKQQEGGVKAGGWEILLDPCPNSARWLLATLAKQQLGI